MNMLRTTRLLAALAPTLVLGACASQGEPQVASACPSGLKVYCETYHGKPQRCFCASRDDLKDVFEPRQEPY